MFPGDVSKNYYCVQITHDGKVDVHFDSDVRSGYEKLAEVRRCKVTLVTTGEILYDGLLEDIHGISHRVKSTKKTTSELYYKIEVYLDTSVGNEYQNKSLIADFEWWVENEDQENLRVAVPTGDNSNTYIWSGIAVVSAFLTIFISFRRKKEESDES